MPWKVTFNIIFFSLVPLLATAGQRIGAAENGNRETKTTSPVNNSDKGMENSNKWFADPARGWIRMEERPELQKKSGTGSSQNQTQSPRGKTMAIFWEY